MKRTSRRIALCFFILLFWAENSAIALNSEMMIIQGPQLRVNLVKSSLAIVAQQDNELLKIEINECNRKKVDQFWETQIKLIEKILPVKIKGNPPKSLIWISTKKGLIPVGPFDPSAEMVQNIPFEFKKVFMEIHRLCKK